jgi:hypothetical protein
MVDYQWQVLYNNRKPKLNINSFQPAFGPIVTKRDEKGKAKKVKFQLLLDNPDCEVYLTGNFVNWEQSLTKLEKN